ncbi:hypothetical protein SAMN05428988_5919 [Chitinophaga sp. YR573]|uniref:zinc ribbon domain-containing protein n=1 Tax=Chitinophaga sp. YR573 TaxID=1881040 RepID=UPI0008D42F9F|nr:zinc ribbon domain-containing protein [Chitinophaga sp. YR573]SEW45020.1 hypothetical protein SAMN05428988_5919 [Chitinophaga sp. YR573]
MESSSITCINCSKSLPLKAKFCSHCLAQLRCKKCNEPLEKEAIGCMECGTPILNKSTTGQPQQSNTITFTETQTERTFQASFSDAVGKDLTGIARDIMNAKHMGIPSILQPLLPANGAEEAEYQEINPAPNVSDLPPNYSPNAVETVATSAIAPRKEDEYPSLMTVAMRRLPSTETEWVVLYGFFASGFGKKMFTRHDLITLYEETKRKSTDKTNALTSNIKAAVQSGKFNAFTDGEYCIMDPGIELAKEIMTRTKASPLPGKSKQSKEEKGEGEDASAASGKGKRGAKSTDKSKRLAEIDFYPTGKDSLKAYFDKFDTKSDFEKVLVFVSYFTEILKTGGITYDHIYSCFDERGLKIPINVAQTTRNTASAKKWINTTDSKNITVTTAGKNKLRHWNND